MQRTVAHEPNLLAASTGDPEARQALVEAHGGLVWSLCRRMCPEPEDAYQEIWEKVFGSLHRFDPHGPGTLKGWIGTITHRHLVDRHRRRKARGQVVPLYEVPAIEPQMDERLARRQQVARLEAAIQRLGEVQRRAVVMHHLQGVSLEEIAEVEGVPLGTVKSRLHRARARLAAVLAGG